MSRRERGDRARLWALGAGMAVASAATALIAWAAWTAFSIQSAGTPDWLGNSPANVRRVAENADPNSLVFYATGDTRFGTRTFRKLLRLMAAEKPDFLVVLGDFSCGRTLADHQFFLYEMGHAAPSFPVFLVPGNHDIKATAEFRLEDFEQTYGPAQHHFRIGANLFIFLNNTPGSYDRTGAYLDYLDQVLAREGRAAQNVFVFAHTPPTGLSPSLDTHPLYRSERYMELAREHRVRFVFAGDHHGYWKGVRDGTAYVVCGGGGARLQGTRGRFHHAVRVAIEDGRVADSVVAVEEVGQGLGVLRRNLALLSRPIGGHGWFALAIAAPILFCASRLLVGLVRRWRAVKARVRSRRRNEPLAPPPVGVPRRRDPAGAPRDALSP